MKMIGEYQLDLNSNEICRNCLARNCELQTLFRCDIIDGEIWPIPKVFKNVTDISVTENDNYPRNICKKCESALFEAFIFKQKSMKSHNLLQKVLKNTQEGDEIDPVCLLLPSDRKSKSTQTGEDEQIFLVDEEVDIKQIKSDLSCIYAEEEDETEASEAYQWVYVAENEVGNEIENEVENEMENEVENEHENEECTIEENCVKSLDEPPDLGTDLIEAHNCEYCCEQIPQSIQETHLKQHTDILPSILSSMEFFRCSRCLKTFLHIDNLLEHFDTEPCEQSLELSKEDGCIDYQYLTDPTEWVLFSTHKNFDNTFSCNLCDLDFEDLQTLHGHFSQSHPAKYSSEYMHPELAHTCGSCEITFTTLQDCLHHLYFHQSEFLCPQENCEHIAKSFATLYYHFTRGHSAESLECSYCSYQAKNRVDMRQHQRFSCAARSFKCGVCGKSFYKRNTLNIHVRTHSNERKYSCTFCPKAFMQTNDLLNHMRTHTLERPFKCDLCGKSFKTIGQKIGHLATHTTECNFECDVCQKTFKSARILRGHKKIHEERQFSCEVCDKKFNRRYHLTIHLKRHEKTNHQKRKGLSKKKKTS